MTGLDTNVLLRRANRTDPRHGEIAAALDRLTDAGAEVCITIQNVMEFWVVATRPVDVNGLGMTPDRARAEIAKFIQAFTLLTDPEDVLDRWLELCTTHAVCGRPAHDARLVAVMLSHGVTRLLTLNPGDFKRYPEIECLAPADV